MSRRETFDAVSRGVFSSYRLNLVDPDDAARIASCVISDPSVASGSNSGGLSDRRMGPSTQHARCETCQGNVLQCLSHLGVLKLPHPVYHPLFCKKAVQYMNCVCWWCGEPLLSPEAAEHDPSLRCKLDTLQEQADPAARFQAWEAACKELRKAEGGFVCTSKRCPSHKNKLPQPKLSNARNSLWPARQFVPGDEPPASSASELFPEAPPHSSSSLPEATAFTKKDVLAITPAQALLLLQSVPNSAWYMMGALEPDGAGSPQDLRVQDLRVHPSNVISQAVLVLPPLLRGGGSNESDLTTLYKHLIKSARMCSALDTLREAGPLPGVVAPKSNSSRDLAKRFGVELLTDKELKDLVEGEREYPFLRGVYRCTMELQMQMNFLFHGRSLLHVEGVLTTPGKVAVVTQVHPPSFPSQRPVTSLTQSVKGKQGKLRGQLSKRCDGTARSVLSNNKALHPEEVGVGLETLVRMHVAEQVFDANRHLMTRLCRNGPRVYPGAHAVCVMDGKTGHADIFDLMTRPFDQLFPEGLPADKECWIKRHPLPGEHIIVNRQPTLHRGSMMAHRIVPVPRRTVELNAASCGPYNADNDGDEINTHYVAGLGPRAELQELMRVSKNLKSPQHHGVLVHPIQSSVIALFQLTQPSTWVPVDMVTEVVEAMNHHISRHADVWPLSSSFGELYRCCFTVGAPFHQHLPQPTPHPVTGEPVVHGRELLSLVLPAVDFQGGGLVVEQGFVRTGVMKKGNTVGLLNAITDRYGNEMGLECVHHLLRLTQVFEQRYTQTSGIGDYILEPEELQQVQDTIQREVHLCDRLFEQMSAGGRGAQRDKIILLIKSRMQLVESRCHQLVEQRMQRMVGQANRNNQRVGPPRLNGLVCTVMPGAKGSTHNMMRMLTCMGNVEKEGKPTLATRENGRTVPYYPRGKHTSESSKFVSSCLVDGLQPEEYAASSVNGRDGMISTSINSQISGQISRQISYGSGDIKVSSTGAVVNESGDMLAGCYNENEALDPCRLMNVTLRGVFLSPLPFSSPEREQTEDLPPGQLPWALLTEEAAASCSDLAHARRVLAFCLHQKTTGMGVSPVATTFAPLDELITYYARQCGAPSPTRDPDQALAQWQQFHRKGRLEALRQSLRQEGRLHCTMDRDSLQWNVVLWKLAEAFLDKGLGGALLQEEVWDALVQHLCHYLGRALVAGSEAVGLLSSQSVAEKIMQLTFNTFHNIWMAHSLQTAFSWVKSIFTANPVASQIKTTLALHEPYCYDLDLACSLARELPLVVLRDVLRGAGRFLYRPRQPSVEGLPLLPPDLSDLGLHSTSHLTVERLAFFSQQHEDDSCSYVSSKTQQSRALFATDGDGYLIHSPWVLVLDLNREKCARWRLTPARIVDILYPVFVGRVQFSWSNQHDSEWRLALRFVQHGSLGRQYTPAEELLLCHGRTFERLRLCRHDANYQACTVLLDKLLDVRLAGMAGISDAVVMPSPGDSKRYEVVLQGKNLRQLVSLYDGVLNITQSGTNDPVECYHLFGVLQAQHSIFTEVLQSLVSSGVTMHTSHLKVLAALMCSEGGISALNRTGIDRKQDIVSKLCFEDPLMFLKSISNQPYKLNTTMGNIVLSQPPNLGTNGFFELLRDRQKERHLLRESQDTQKAQQRPAYDPVEDICGAEDAERERSQQAERVRALMRAHGREHRKRRVFLDESLFSGCVDGEMIRAVEETRGWDPATVY